MEDSSTKNPNNSWLQILEHNESDIKISNTAECFIPQNNFDQILAQELQANECYPNYVTLLEQTAEKETDFQRAEEIEQLPYREARIPTLDQQLSVLQQDEKMRNKLSNDFANRTFPWYIQRPSTASNLQITEEIKQQFKDAFELEILENVQHFKCDLMVIDVAPAVALTYLERWVKFAPYLTIVTVIHDCQLYEGVKSSHFNFQPIHMVENVENSWHGELQRSLDMAVGKAKELFLLDNVSKSIVFVFAHKRGLCVCDKFKILRKS